MIAIIGSGIAGLQAACQLQQAGVAFCVLEAGQALGGLARTGAYQHWRFDYGVKALYSQNSAVMDYLRALPVEYVEHERHAAVHHVSAGGERGLDITYPFENGIGELPLADKVACVLGYLEASTAQQPFANFQEWIIHRLGRGIAEQFMLPYNP